MKSGILSKEILVLSAQLMMDSTLKEVIAFLANSAVKLVTLSPNAKLAQNDKKFNQMESALT